MSRLSLLLLLAWLITESFTGLANDAWSNTDKSLACVFTGLQVIDGLQIERIVDTPGHQEGNPILGPYPSDAKIVRYFVGTTLLTLGAAHYFPSLRRPLLVTGVGLQLYSVRWPWYVIPRRMTASKKVRYAHPLFFPRYLEIDFSIYKERSKPRYTVSRST